MLRPLHPDGVRPALLLIGCLLLAACSADDPAAPRAGAVTPAPEPVRASPSAATEDEADPAAASPTPQDARSPVAAAPAGPAVQGDVDGDGEPDEVAVGTQLRVVLSGSGRTVSSAVDADDPPAQRGVEDVDRDGRGEVFVRTAQGASTTFVTPFRYDGARLAPLTVDGAPVRLGIGGSATHGDGFSCTDAGTLVVRSAQEREDGTWEVSSTTYEVRGHALIGVEASGKAGLAQSDPLVGQAYVVDCRSVAEGA